MEHLFYIKQRVVANKDHSQGDYKKGDEFIVLDSKEFCCYVGIKIKQHNIHNCFTHCHTCNMNHQNLYGFYYDQENFSPLQDLSNMTYEDAIIMTSKILIH